MNFHKYFKNKKITVMGLGLLGRGVNVVKFLAECEAEIIVTDLKSEKDLAPSLLQLKKFKNIRFVLGEHRLEDFHGRDMIIKAAGVPLDSPFITEARKQKIPVEMDASLFARLAPGGMTLIGVTGTRGKSTTTQLIFEILKKHVALQDGSRNAKKGRVFLAGNVRGVATLPLLKKARVGDIVILELDSWQLQGFGDAQISPQIAVFTTFLDDHLNYYKGSRRRYLADKANIFKFQSHQAHRRPQTHFIVGIQAAPIIRNYYPKDAKRMKVVESADIPKTWKLKIPGEHNRYNAALALAAANALNIPRATSRMAVEAFRGLPGRLEYLRTVRGIQIYNDNNATTPDATIAAMKALTGNVLKLSFNKKGGRVKKIVLIMGGADKGLDMTLLLKEIPKYCKAIITLPGTGTDRIFSELPVGVVQTKNLPQAVQQALKQTASNDILLFSPAFASFGLFKNEYDRNDQFCALIKKFPKVWRK